MIEKRFASKVLNTLLETGASFSEIFIQKMSASSLKLEDSSIENCSSGYDLGCGLRIWNGDSTYYAYVDSIKESRILDAARVLGGAVKSTGQLKVADLIENKSAYRLSIKKYPHLISADNKKEILLSVDKTARDFSPHIVQVTASISDLEEEIFIANSLGECSGEKVVKTLLSVNVVALRKKEIRTGHKTLAETRGFEALEAGRAEKLAKEASHIAVVMLDAINAPVGLIPVVIGPAFGGVIFHEACGHGLEADSVLKDASVFKGKLGKKVASESVTAIDDSSIPHHWGSFKYDGEGFTSGSTVLIKDGILVNFINDLKSSIKMKKPRTGNGRRQSYRDSPMPRMTNTYIANGKDDPSSIIRSVNRGIYAKEFAGGQVEPATGDFVFGISEGYLIEKGEIGQPIKGATLIGNGPDILKKIEAVGNDLDFAPGFCGKGGQSVTNEVGQPTIKVSKITVGGTGKKL
ncbi:MAG: TldD/PmbA family protein [Actinobacteria bacterium]|nr:TldD/PmbA family protein [Actinomycetota bacterium]